MLGSMVLNVLSVFVFSLGERKNENKRKIKYRCYILDARETA